MNSQDAGGRSLPILQLPAKHEDPVCGMMVVPEKAAGKIEHAGKTYYFCSKSCAERFSQDPGKFLATSSIAGMEHSPAPAGPRAGPGRTSPGVGPRSGRRPGPRTPPSPRRTDAAPARRRARLAAEGETVQSKRRQDVEGMGADAVEGAHDAQGEGAAGHA